MEGKDWAIIVATLFGPILAVQAQKWIEKSREARQGKLNIFSTLMATRAARVSVDHVRALNLIDVTFQGRSLLGVRFQTRSNRAVLSSWHDYLSSLGDLSQPGSHERSQELFVDLLHSISAALRFDLDRFQIRQLVYAPVAHVQAENDHAALQKGLLDLVHQKTVLKMEVTSFPADPVAVEAQAALTAKLSAALSEGALAVRLNTDPRRSGSS